MCEWGYWDELRSPTGRSVTPCVLHIAALGGPRPPGLDIPDARAH
jgi:hypothetical protein